MFVCAHPCLSQVDMSQSGRIQIIGYRYLVQSDQIPYHIDNIVLYQLIPIYSVLLLRHFGKFDCDVLRDVVGFELSSLLAVSHQKKQKTEIHTQLQLCFETVCFLGVVNFG